MKDTDKTTDLTAYVTTANHSYFSFDLRKQVGRDKFIAFGLKSGGAVYINVFNKYTK